MKYRLIFETTNPELYRIIQDQTREVMHEYNIKTKADRKETKSSFQIKIEAQIHGNKKLENRKSDNSDQDYIYLDE